MTTNSMMKWIQDRRCNLIWLKCIWVKYSMVNNFSREECQLCSSFYFILVECQCYISLEWFSLPSPSISIKYWFSSITKGQGLSTGPFHFLPKSSSKLDWLSILLELHLCWRIQNLLKRRKAPKVIVHNNSFSSTKWKTN